MPTTKCSGDEQLPSVRLTIRNPMRIEIVMGTTRWVRGNWYWLAAIPVVAFFVIWLVDSVKFDVVIEQAPRVVVPGTSEIELEPGEYTVYGETRSVLGGVRFRALSIDRRCDMKALPWGESIALRRRDWSETYRLRDYEGSAMFEVTIPRAGRYRVHCK